MFGIDDLASGLIGRCRRHMSARRARSAGIQAAGSVTRLELGERVTGGACRGVLGEVCVARPLR